VYKSANTSLYSQRLLCLYFPTDNKPSSHIAHNSAVVRWLRGVPVDEKTIEIVSGNIEKYIPFDC